MRRTAFALAAAGIATLLSGAGFAQETVIGGMVFQQDQFFRGIQLGFEVSAKESGATLLQGNSDNKLEKEAELIDTFIARGAKAVVLAPLNSDASIPALERARDAGVKVVLYGTSINSDFQVADVGTSQLDIGRFTGEAAARYIKENLGGKAKIALLGFRSQLQQMSDDRTNGFLEKAKDGVELDVVATQDAWLAENAVTVATDILTANPDIQVIYAANEGGTVGAVQAVRAAGKQGKVFVFGTDGSEQLAGFLLDEDNVLIATTAQQPVEIGKKAADVAAAAIKGEATEKYYDIPPLALSRYDLDGVKAYAESVKQ
ncbi:substrate-binding domain-containing protein [Devosia sp. CN2-171]|jgi:sugar transport system substrate-binding protein|uniref:substrate-binding domain-containing protein n=1 Tax=Devosia sp. CN2-171 TaxID=3400909 RepID=UPI003BF82BFF